MRFPKSVFAFLDPRFDGELRCWLGARMHRKRILLEHQAQFVAIFLFEPGDCGYHALAKWALEVAKHDHRDEGCFFAPHRRSIERHSPNGGIGWLRWLCLRHLEILIGQLSV